MSLINEIGNIYHYLTVVDRAPNDKNGRAMWRCKCKCGNETIVLGKHLRSGNTKSCGCFQKEQVKYSNMNRVENLIGKRFGKLLVISEIGFIKHFSGKNSRVYNCLCDCGNYCEIQHQYLAFGDTTSCGCLRSKGEFQIETLLKKHSIEFKREFTFEDLADKNNLRFDFAIFKNGKLVYLIEFQGEQHFNKNSGFYSEDMVKHDLMKKEYCNQNNIRLLEIKYKRNYNIQYEDLKMEEMFNGLYSE